MAAARRDQRGVAMSSPLALLSVGRRRGRRCRVRASPTATTSEPARRPPPPVVASAAADPDDHRRPRTGRQEEAGRRRSRSCAAAAPTSRSTTTPGSAAWPAAPRPAPRAPAGRSSAPTTGTAPSPASTVYYPARLKDAGQAARQGPRHQAAQAGHRPDARRPAHRDPHPRLLLSLPSTGSRRWSSAPSRPRTGTTAWSAVARDVLVGLDFDGTLSPIVEDPAQARHPPRRAPACSPTLAARCAPSW